MVLRKANTTIESSDDTVVAEDTSTINMFEEAATPTPEQEQAPAPEQVAAAQEVASTAIATAKSTSVGAPVRSVVNAFDALLNTMPVEAVMDLGYKALPCITCEPGKFAMDGEELGNTITLQPISWNRRFMIVTGAEGSEAKEKLRISYDGVTCIQTGEAVKDVLESFRAEGYKKAASKPYIDLWGCVTHIDGKEVPEDEKFDFEIVQVQLSPESVKQFKAFGMKLAFRQGRGGSTDTPDIVIKANRGDMNGNKFGYCTFSLK